jgi:hypothetical protein
MVTKIDGTGYVVSPLDGVNQVSRKRRWRASPLHEAAQTTGIHMDTIAASGSAARTQKAVYGAAARRWLMPIAGRSLRASTMTASGPKADKTAALTDVG